MESEIRLGAESGKEQNGLTSLHLLAVLRHVIWTNGAQEFNVVITVVLGHLLSIGFVRALEGRKEKGQVILFPQPKFLFTFLDF